MKAMPKPSHKKNRRQHQLEQESRAAEAVTAFWVMSVVTVFLCDLAAAAARWYTRANPNQEKMAILAGLLLFAATATGIISLLLMPLVYRARREPPPRGFVVFAVVVGVMPILIAVVSAMG